MKFHELETLYSILKRTGLVEPGEDLDRFSQKWIQFEYRGNNISGAEQITLEHMWMKEGRPYYSLYPFVAENLIRANLDVPGEQFTKSVVIFPSVIQIRLPEGQEISIGTKKVRAFFAQRVKVSSDDENDNELRDGIFLLVDVNEMVSRKVDDFEFLVPQYNRVCMALTHETVFSAYDSFELSGQDDDDREITKICLKLYVALSMLVNDPEMVKPDVLAVDRTKFENAKTDEHRQTIVERARRRGKTGWVIGEGIEFSPHIRRSHFAIRWMGHGDDKQPVLRHVKAAVVKRKSITEIPTGYLDDEEVQSSNEISNSPDSIA